MAKVKKAFFCQNCGAESPKWAGKCNACEEWNTYVEEIIVKENPKQVSFSSKKTKYPQPIQDIVYTKEERLVTNDGELNRVLGGGIVGGSLVLIGGEPGIGKSTLLLQLAVSNPYKLLYVSGEESEQQIKMRAERIGVQNENCFILTETSTAKIFEQAKEMQPQLIVIDSIQTLFTSVIESSAGSVSQIRECTSEMMRYAKETNTPIFIIGHITKDGNIAGPKVLEHMVDTVIQFEGDSNHVYRLIRATKNRFGSTNELGIYEMRGTGLRQVENPSEILISSSQEGLSGTSIASTIEGVRPLLIEVQALVSSAAYGTPQRSSTGFDLRRLNMLLAVLEKRCGFRLGAKDVFLNIAGGIKVSDPAIDLAVVCSVLSSNEDIDIPKGCCFSGEVGLSGEIRPVNKIEQRIVEADKMGFEKIFISQTNVKGIDKDKYNVEIVAVKRVDEVFTALFG
jgi:DNA repair protein RadA/Sms